ncbi:hypothetical protein PORCRE_743 [Porphyromonas crevioricanis JCM 15906]|uniref:Uncharacterized protein n=1 Tax=Porphyromonas crevioricanis JCM 15906 TaxID=1305617 RepID=T1DR16_9PORP|nr:hypothetical protein PORCRE_743 [Porphyromonas crevioricanis JCM 15906]GAD08146.1 hypothetical protein PORCAN_1781 [Porphyromonas crevioricanis JCM 13913]
MGIHRIFFRFSLSERPYRLGSVSVYLIPLGGATALSSLA